MAKRQKNRQHNDQKTEEQTTQWTKDRRTDNTMAKSKKYKQRSTKHTHKTKDGVTGNPPSIGVNLGARSTINN
jgi:hypothetical protein